MRHTVIALFALTLACAPASQLRAPTSVDLVVATTTDVHGRVTAWDYYANRSDAARGLSRAATIVDSVRAANPGRVVLLDAGDLLQGNPLAYVAARVSRDRTNPIVAAMNTMQYDASAIGTMNTIMEFPISILRYSRRHFHFCRQTPTASIPPERTHIGRGRSSSAPGSK